LSLYERRASLTPTEQSTFDSLYEECAKFEAVEENRGKLWPYLLGGVAALIGVILLVVFFNTEPPIYD
jgi:hypothetical protein